MINIIEGDLFTTNAEIICHQINCQGIMGSGVALQVKKKYPHVFSEYIKYCGRNSDILGTVLEVPIKPILTMSSEKIPGWQIICNLFAQDQFGYTGECYTLYEALQKCLDYVKSITLRKNNFYNATVAMPYLMGCHRGGGNWGQVYNMIEDTFKDRNVLLYRLGGQ